MRQQAKLFEERFFQMLITKNNIVRFLAAACIFFVAALAAYGLKTWTTDWAGKITLFGAIIVCLTFLRTVWKMSELSIAQKDT